MLHVLFVCTANLCRSPMADAVFRRLVAEAGLTAQVASGSAGTHRYRIGDPPDPRAVAALKRRGYAAVDARARQVTHADLLRADWVLAMDYANLQALDLLCPPDLRHRVDLLMKHAGGDPKQLVVPDPVRGDDAAFDRALAQIEAACHGVVRAATARLETLARIESRDAA